MLRVALQAESQSERYDVLSGECCSGLSPVIEYINLSRDLRNMDILPPTCYTPVDVTHHLESVNASEYLLYFLLLTQN